MELFLNARGYQLLAPEDVRLDYRAIHDTVVKSVKNPQRWDFDLTLSELPHALTCVINGEIFVHVVKKKENNEQAFFLVASNESGILKKPIIAALLEKSTKIAHTIVVLNEISKQAKCLMIIPAVENVSYQAELILKQDVSFPKLRCKFVPRYQILNETEKNELLAKYKTTGEKIPWMYDHEPMARYFGFERGMVLRVLEKDIQYRLVIS